MAGVGVYSSTLSPPPQNTHTHTDTDKQTIGRKPLDEGSAPRRGLYLYNTQQSQQKNIYAPGGIRNHNPRTRATIGLHLIPRSYWNR